jgi:hypothetical protein
MMTVRQMSMVYATVTDDILKILKREKLKIATQMIIDSD